MQQSDEQGKPEASANLEPLFIGAVHKEPKHKAVINNDEYFVFLPISGSSSRIKFKVDTGSQVNIIPASTFQTPRNIHIETSKPMFRLMHYSGNTLQIQCRCTFKCKDQSLDFCVVETNQSAVLGCKASQQLGLIKTAMNIGLVENIVAQFPKVFNGLGCLSQPYKISVDPSVTPVASPPRNQPVLLRTRLKQSLDEMESKHVIRKVDKPTDWIIQW